MDGSNFIDALAYLFDQRMARVALPHDMDTPGATQHAGQRRGDGVVLAQLVHPLVEHGFDKHSAIEKGLREAHHFGVVEG
jgi:hypothetical protein